MRYLKLYEAFKSRGISSTINFLSKKVSKSSSDEFLSDLKTFMSKFDYPIDKLNDSFIKYLSSKKAIELKNDDKVTNRQNIWVIKYWFSLEDGYLGYTSTGNDRFPYTKRVDGKMGPRYKQPEKFDDSQLEYIKENVVNNGEIWPVSDYNVLKTGDVVLGIFGDERNRNISLATIFIDEGDNNRHYAIQGVNDGSTPVDSAWTEYRYYGNYSWWLCDNGEMGNDHHKLHCWSPTSEELRYIQPPSKTDSTETEPEVVSPMTWNLPLTRDFKPTEWDSRYLSIESPKKVEEADFALVLMYDDLLNVDRDAPDFEPVSDIQSVRRKSKQGAIVFMSDEEIKNLNYENYMNKILSIWGIKPTSIDEEFINLQKLFLSCFCGKYILFSFISEYPSLEKFKRFESSLVYLIKTSEEDKINQLQRLRNIFEELKGESKKYFLRYKGSTDRVMEFGNDTTKSTFNKINSLSDKIVEHLNNNEINNIGDLRILMFKLKSIGNFISENIDDFSGGLQRTLNNFRYNDSDVSDGLSIMNKRDQKQIDEDDRFLSLIEKFINKTLN